MSAEDRSAIHLRIDPTTGAVHEVIHRPNGTTEERESWRKLWGEPIMVEGKPLAVWDHGEGGVDFVWGTIHDWYSRGFLESLGEGDFDQGVLKVVDRVSTSGGMRLGPKTFSQTEIMTISPEMLAFAEAV